MKKLSLIILSLFIFFINVSTSYSKEHKQVKSNKGQKQSITQNTTSNNSDKTNIRRDDFKDESSFIDPYSFPEPPNRRYSNPNQ